MIDTPPNHAPATTRTAFAPVVVAGTAIAVALVTWILARNGFDPTVLIAFGVGAEEIVAYAEQVLGQSVRLRPGYGHDGRFFFLQALDPFIVDPDGPASLLGRPLYRSQRMAFPMIASGGGLVPATWLPWTMIATNVGAVAVGTWATARIAVRRGASRWLGLTFAANLGVAIEIGIGAGGVVAMAAAMAGIDQLDRGNRTPAIAWFAVAALAREATLLFAFGVALAEWIRTRRIPLPFLAVPGAVLAWSLYLRWRLGGRTGANEVIEIGPPLQGLLDATVRWDFGLDGTLNIVTAIAIAMAAAIVIRHAIEGLDHLAWGAAAMTVLVVILSRPVWQNYYDIGRAAAPILTAALVLGFSRRAPVS